MNDISKFTDLAKQQILKEQLEKRVIVLDDWLKECDAVWKEHHTLLPYPKHPTWPSDDDVNARAKIMYDSQQENNKKETNEKVIKPMVEQPKEEVEVIKINSTNSENQKSNTQSTEKIVFNSAENELPRFLKYRKN
jgi:hypothetical protein